MEKVWLKSYESHVPPSIAYPLEALQEAIRRTQRPQIAAENLAALEASARLL